jgi:hypothetical protein
MSAASLLSSSERKALSPQHFTAKEQASPRSDVHKNITRRLEVDLKKEDESTPASPAGEAGLLLDENDGAFALEVHCCLLRGDWGSDRGDSRLAKKTASGRTPLPLD